MQKISINTIGLLGDSISRGIMLDGATGKYKIMDHNAADMFQTSHNISVKNYSRFGGTSRKALQLLPGILSGGDATDIILLELGGNDCDFNWDMVAGAPTAAQTPNVPLAEFRDNMSKIIDMILAAGKHPVIMTLPPIDSDKYFDWIARGDAARARNLMIFLGDKNYIYRHQELYATALNTLAVKYELFTIPLRESFLSIPKYSDYLCDDGIHLNARGHDVMSSVFDKTYDDYINDNAGVVTNTTTETSGYRR